MMETDFIELRRECFRHALAMAGSDGDILHVLYDAATIEQFIVCGRLPDTTPVSLKEAA